MSGASPLVLRPFDKLRVVLSNVEGRQAQDERRYQTTGLWVPATAAAAVVGALVAVSPAGVTMILALAGIAAFTARGTTGRYRRAVYGTLAIAMGLRLAIVALLPLAALALERSLVAMLGDSSYLIARSTWIRNVFVGQPIAPRDYFEAFTKPYGASAFNYILAYVQVVFGPAPYALHLFSTVLFFSAVAIMFRLARRSFGDAAALVGLVILSFLPTLFIWSTSPLKEPPFFLLLAGIVAVTVQIARGGPWWRRGAAALAFVGLLLTARAIRGDAAPLVVAIVGCGIWIAMVARGRRWAVVILAVSILAVGVAATRPRVQAIVASNVQLAIARHLGNVFTAGHFYKVLDDQMYVDPAIAAWQPDARATARFLAQSWLRFLTVPEPWSVATRAELLIIPQQMVWYGLLILAPIGIVYGLRADRLMTSVCAGALIAGTLLIGPNSGNVGTVLRHRDTILPFVAWLSALGAVRVVALARPRRVNVIDAAAIAIVIGAIPVGYGLHFLLREPATRLDAVEPRTGGVPSRVTLRGANLKPFLRAFLAPSGAAMVPLDRRGSGSLGDNVPEASYFIRRGDLAELELPPLPLGAYDLGLFDGANQVAILRSAFTVTRNDATHTGVVVASGRFTALDAGAARALVAGTTLTTGSGEAAGEILDIGPDRSDVVAIGHPSAPTWVRVDSRLQRAARLRLRCKMTATSCELAGQALAAGATIDLAVAPHVVRLAIDAIEPDAPLSDGLAAEAEVEFVAAPQVAAAVRSGDRDRGSDARPVRIVRITSKAPVKVDNRLAGLGGQDWFVVPDEAVRLTAVVSIPVLPDGTFTHRNNPRRIGDGIEFETPTYHMSGRIVARLPRPTGQ